MFEIREATEADLEGISKLIKSEEELFLVYPSGKYPFTKEQIVELFEVRKELTVAIERNKIVGFANLYDYEPGSSVFIGNLVVDDQHRGRGLGRALVLHMLNIAFTNLNLPEVRISVFSENSPALLLYSRIGFIPYKIEERTNPQGRRVALIHMKLSR